MRPYQTALRSGAAAGSWCCALFLAASEQGLEQIELPYSDDKRVGVLPWGFSAAALLMEISRSWCLQWGFAKCCIDA